MGRSAEAIRRGGHGASAELGTSVETLRVWVTRLRHRYRNALRAEVASTVSNPAEIDTELHHVYQILTS